MSEKKTPQDSASSLKLSLTVALMIPVVIAIVAGAFVSLDNFEEGLPLLASGILLVVFNTVILKILFARLAAEQAKSEQHDESEGSE